jgi:hypothetical protein
MEDESTLTTMTAIDMAEFNTTAIIVGFSLYAMGDKDPAYSKSMEIYLSNFEPAEA